MNSNFGSTSYSNWGSSSNSKLEEKWEQMRREDEESDEEVQARCNEQNRAAAMIAAMVCQPTEEQPQWDGSIAGCYYKPRHRAMMHANLMNNYFNPKSKRDRAGRPDLSPHHKVIVALRMMAYGSPADSMDETHGMSKSTCLDSFEQLCDIIVQVYKDEYLR
ncbi:uncharacterized protein [Malus domestica]|uniref:uncharacterized protein n=1 Tax=Malus domestica TaxID=3750 RepID=UPI0039757EAB